MVKILQSCLFVFHDFGLVCFQSSYLIYLVLARSICGTKCQQPKDMYTPPNSIIHRSTRCVSICYNQIFLYFLCLYKGFSSNKVSHGLNTNKIRKDPNDRVSKALIACSPSKASDFDNTMTRVTKDCFWSCQKPSDGE